LRKIYLARHGQVAPDGVLVGQADWPLTEEGRAEIGRLRESLKGATFQMAFVSPLQRAKETLAILLAGAEIPVQVEPDLREITLGQWDGLAKAEIRERWPLLWAWRGENWLDNPPPGGETFRQLAARVWPAFDRIKAQAPDRTLVVAHQAVNRVILARERNLPLENLLEIPQPTGALNVLEFF
jgi:probable phosphoglycerate mutase